MEVYKEDSEGVFKEKGKEKKGQYFSFSHLQCDICKQQVSVLTPWNLENLIWEWAGRYQKVTLNPDVHKKYIEICLDCMNKLTHSGTHCIKIFDGLIDATTSKKLKMIKKRTSVKTKKLNETQNTIC